MLEVEVKIKVSDLSQVRSRLLDGGAVKSGDETQRDVYYNAPHRDFAVTDEAFRIRYTDEAAEVTYKGPKLKTAAMKAREEINLNVSSGEKFEQMIERLGFSRSAEVRKEREEFRWKDTSIALDNVNGLGTFVEIEVLTDGNEGGALKAIESVKNDLGVTGPHITASYLELLFSKQS